nr:hypothetical protein CFP56_42135 [Quercus suber]
MTNVDGAVVWQPRELGCTNGGSVTSVARNDELKLGSPRESRLTISTPPGPSGGTSSSPYARTGRQVAKRAVPTVLFYRVGPLENLAGASLPQSIALFSPPQLFLQGVIDVSIVMQSTHTYTDASQGVCARTEPGLRFQVHNNERSGTLCLCACTTGTSATAFPPRSRITAAKIRRLGAMPIYSFSSSPCGIVDIICLCQSTSSHGLRNLVRMARQSSTVYAMKKLHS